MKYIKFKSGVISRIDTFRKRTKGEERIKLVEALTAFKQAKNNIIEEKYFDVLREHDDYADNFIDYYLNSREEEKYIVRYRYELIDHVLAKSNRQNKLVRRQIFVALDNKVGPYILIKYLRKIEYLLDIDLRNYIVKVGILDRGSEFKVLTDKEECEIMYDIARRLSVKHNIGYMLSYVEKSIEVEKDNVKLELYWDKGCVYHGKYMIANLLIGTNKVVEKIVKYVKKEMRLKNEIK